MTFDPRFDPHLTDGTSISIYPLTQVPPIALARIEGGRCPACAQRLGFQSEDPSGDDDFPRYAICPKTGVRFRLESGHVPRLIMSAAHVFEQ